MFASFSHIAAFYAHRETRARAARASKAIDKAFRLARNYRALSGFPPPPGWQG